MSYEVLNITIKNIYFMYFSTFSGKINLRGCGQRVKLQSKASKIWGKSMEWVTSHEYCLLERRDGAECVLLRSYWILLMSTCAVRIRSALEPDKGNKATRGKPEPACSGQTSLHRDKEIVNKTKDANSCSIYTYAWRSITEPVVTSSWPGFQSFSNQRQISRSFALFFI